MILCLDAGNSRLKAGLFGSGKILFSFAMDLSPHHTRDEIGLFLRKHISDKGFNPALIDRIAYCSVVRELNEQIEQGCLGYLKRKPFTLKHGINSGLTICYDNPEKLGADRFAAAIGARSLYPRRDIIVVDMGTATTLETINAEGEYRGGAILPGMKLAMASLERGTSALSRISLSKPERGCGKNTEECIRSGLFYGHLGAVKGVIRAITEEEFKGGKPLIIGTGGLAGLFAKEGVFDKHLPDLVLQGINISQELNK